MSRRNSRRLLPLPSAIFAAGLIGGIMIMVDASGSAGFPAGDAPRPWHAQPADLATQSQVMEAVGASVRPEERRVGKECVSTCRSRESEDHLTKKRERQFRYVQLLVDAK